MSPRTYPGLVATPEWAGRLARDRAARGMSQRDAAERLALHSDEPLASPDSVLRSWKRWEAGKAKPSPVYQAAIARMFESVPSAYFGADEPAALARLSDDETVELVARLRSSRLDDATLDAMRLTVEGLCTDYSHADNAVLREQAHEWLRHLGGVLASQLTYRQHRDVLTMAGWLTLLASCLSWDKTDATGAERARQSAISLGTDIGNREILGWASEIRAWIALTTGDLPGAVAASREGLAATVEHSVAVQLYAQEAKAFARMGDKTRAHVALDRGRELMAALPLPTNPRNHFEVDPVKVDFYAMDVWRLLGEDALAASAAETIRRTSSAPDGKPLSPMRLAEARMTDATILARHGDLDGALSLAEAALQGDRQSMPSLLMVGAEFAGELSRMDRSKGADYRAHLADLADQD
jgi:transcriptional regulator with XRE-family HTH domain